MQYKMMVGRCSGRLLRLELLPSNRKLVGNNIAELLDVSQAFLQSLDGGGALCSSLVCAVGVRGTGPTVGLDSDIHLGLRGMRDGVGAELDIGTIRNVRDGSGERGLVTRDTPATA